MIITKLSYPKKFPLNLLLVFEEINMLKSPMLMTMSQSNHYQVPNRQSETKDILQNFV